MSARRYFVYGLHLGDDRVRYVGQTFNPSERLRKHKSNAKNGATSPVYQWMRRQGTGKVRMMILRECGTRDEADAAEIELIATYREIEPELLNVSPGGVSFDETSPETKAKIVATTKARIAAGLIEDRMTGHHEDNVSAKITEAQAKEIISRMWFEKTTAIADSMGIVESIVIHIKYGNTWRHLERPPRPAVPIQFYVRHEASSKAKISMPIARALRAEFAEGGVSVAELARRHGISWGIVDGVVKNRFWVETEGVAA